MARSSLLTLTFTLLGMACATRQDPAGSSAPTVAAAMAEGRHLYSLGESRFAEGEPRDAVTLWRAALLRLPESAEADAIRHRVILRMGHALLVAYEEGDIDALLLAQQVLARYIAWHEARWGEGQGAAAERAEAYALLVAAEDTLDRLDRLAVDRGAAPLEPVDAAPDDAALDDAALDDLMLADASSAPISVDPRAATAPLEAVAIEEDDASAARPTPTLVLDGTPHRRDIEVKRLGSDFRDHPGVQRFFGGSPMVGGAIVQGYHRGFIDKPRVLVRAGATSVRREVAQPDRRSAKSRARGAVAAVRSRLARCYIEAVGRGLSDDVRLVLDVEVAADGRLAVSALRLRGEDTLDRRGQRCVRDAVQAAAPTAPPPGRDVLVQLPVTLFVQLPRAKPELDIHAKALHIALNGMDNGAGGPAGRPQDRTATESASSLPSLRP